MRLSVPSDDQTMALSTGERLVELDRRTASRPPTVQPVGALGIVKEAPAASSVSGSGTSQAAATSVVPLTADLLPGRRYVLYAPNLGFTGPSGGMVVAQITATLDGSAAGVSSPRLAQTTCDTSPSARGCHPFARLNGAAAGGQLVPLSALLSFYAVVAGSYTCIVQADWPALLILEDKGPLT